MSLKELHEFWFDDIQVTEDYYRTQVPRWFFGKDVAFDRECGRRFVSWTKFYDAVPGATPQAHLAKIILFDQIPRNAFRGSAKAHLFDHKARALALHALGTSFESSLGLPERLFLYMPLQHAEDLTLQDLSVDSFERMHHEAPAAIHNWTALALVKAQAHRETIRRFGRFPQRNLKLGRVNSREEWEFLRTATQS